MFEVIVLSCLIFMVISQFIILNLFYKKLTSLEESIFQIKYNRINREDGCIITKKTAANRNARTQEQKAQASAKRKAWWDKKRAQEAKSSEPVQQPKQN